MHPRRGKCFARARRRRRRGWWAWWPRGRGRGSCRPLGVECNYFHAQVRTSGHPFALHQRGSISSRLAVERLFQTVPDCSRLQSLGPSPARHGAWLVSRGCRIVAKAVTSCRAARLAGLTFLVRPPCSQAPFTEMLFPPQDGSNPSARTGARDAGEKREEGGGG